MKGSDIECVLQSARAAGKAIGWYDHALLSREPAMRRTWSVFAVSRPFWSMPRS